MLCWWSFDPVKEAGLDLDFGGQEVLGVGLALGVEEERHRAAAPEACVEEEVAGTEVGNLVAVDTAPADPGEALLHEGRCDGLHHPAVDRNAPGEEADVAGVALVAGSGQTEPAEGHPHHFAATAAGWSGWRLRAERFAGWGCRREVRGGRGVVEGSRALRAPTCAQTR